MKEDNMYNIMGTFRAFSYTLHFREHGPWRLNWEFRGVLLKIGNF